jgi:endonuclease/exonuclease/phosphatase family metal-dependent hydrolase
MIRRSSKGAADLPEMTRRTLPSWRHDTRLRVLTYNILHGGRGREEHIAAVLERARADVIALQEASDLGMVRRLATRLGMHTVVAKPSDAMPLNLVVLSRRRLARWRSHQHHGRMLRAHLECEIDTGSPRLPRVRLHCVHLAARFGERANGEVRRMRELGAIMGDIEDAPNVPHLVLGDFNAIAPGDVVAASAFLERMAELRRAGCVVRGRDGLMGPVRRRPHGDPAVDELWRAVGINPSLDVGVPRLPWIVGPLTELLPRSPATDRVLNALIERRTVQHLLELGYVDCYRVLHQDHGYTCATWLPAARIDYVFTDPTLAPWLRSCAVIGSSSHPDADVPAASDHLPVMAEFDLA